MLARFKEKISNITLDEWLFKGLATILILYHSNYEIDNYLQLVLGVVLLFHWKNKYLWTLMAFIQGAYLLINWFKYDDHFFLMFFMTLSGAVYLWEVSLEHLKKAFSLYLSMVIGLAAIYKMMNFPEYGSGNFTLFSIAFDERFMLLAKFFPVDLTKLHEEVYAVYSFSKPVISNENIKPMFSVIEYIVLIIEISLCLVYLPLRIKIFEKVRSYVLLLFLSLIYFVTPVLAFGHCFCLIGGVIDGEKKGHFLFMAFLLFIYLFVSTLLRIY